MLLCVTVYFTRLWITEISYCPDSIEQRGSSTGWKQKRCTELLARMAWQRLLHLLKNCIFQLHCTFQTPGTQAWPYDCVPVNEMWAEMKCAFPTQGFKEQVCPPISSFPFLWLHAENESLCSKSLCRRGLLPIRTPAPDNYINKKLYCIWAIIHFVVHLLE